MMNKEGQLDYEQCFILNNDRCAHINYLQVSFT